MPAKKKVSLGGLQQRRPADAQDAAQGYQAGDDIVFDDDQNLDQIPHQVQKSAHASQTKDVKLFTSPDSDSEPEPSALCVRGNLRPWLTLLFLAYLFYVSFLVCPRPGHESDAVCRGLALVERGRHVAVQQLDHLGHPYLEQAQEHLQPYWEPVQPHYQAFRDHTDPVIARAQQVYDTTVLPKTLQYYQQARTRAGPLQQELIRTYQLHGKPVVQRYTKFYGSIWRLNVAPALSHLNHHAQLKCSQGLTYAQNRIDAFQAEHFPALHAWTTQTLFPILRQSYQVTMQTLRTLYRFFVVHFYPATKSAYLATVKTVKGNIVPQLRRWHSLYITPQIERVKERVWQHRAEKLSQAYEQEVSEEADKISSAVESAAAVDLHNEPSADLSKEPSPSVATTADPTSEPTVAPTAESTPVSATSAESSSTAPVSEEQSDPLYNNLEEEAKAKIAAKRLAISSRHSELEAKLAELAAAEKALLQERLSSSSERAAVDIEYRFEAKLRDLRSDSERNIKRLQRWAEKRKDSPLGPVEVDATVNKAQSKVIEKAGELVDELDAYREERSKQLDRAVDEAMAGIKKLLNEPRNQLARDYAWLEDVTHQDWQRFHKLAKEEDRYAQEFRALAMRQLAEAQLNEYEETVDSVADSFSEITEAIRRKVKARAGSGPAFAQATESLAAFAEAASSTAASLAGATSSSPTNAPESAASFWAQVTDHAAEVLEENGPSDLLESLAEAVQGVSTSATAYYQSATDSLAGLTSDTDAEVMPSAAEQVLDEVDQPGPTIEDAHVEPSPDLSSASASLDAVQPEAGDYVFAAETPSLQAPTEEGVRGTIPELFEDPTPSVEEAQDITASDITSSSPTSVPKPVIETERPGNVHDAYSGVHDEL